MDEERQEDKLETSYSSSVPRRDIALKTCREQWTIKKGGAKGSRIFLQMVRHYC